MDENTKKDLTRKLKSAFNIAETRAKRVQEIRKAKAEAGPVKDDPDKPNYKKYKFKNDLKTKTHRIIKGMKLHFKNGEWASYKLGKIDTVVGRDMELYLLKDLRSRYSGLSKIDCILLMQTRTLSWIIQKKKNVLQ